MLICDKYKFIFIHVTKAAGTSIEQTFRSDSFFSKRYVCAMDARNFVGQKKWEKYFKFAIVRNPWDKIVSMYRYRKKIGRISKGLSFKKFIKLIDSAKIKHDDGRKHKFFTCNQLDCCVDEDGEVILDYIGRFEKLQKHWKYICRKIGKNRILPHVKSSKKKKQKGYQTYYDDETKKLVAARFSKDIEYFGYEF